MEEIRLNDPRLTRPERQVLRTIALRIEGGLPDPRIKASSLFAAPTEDGKHGDQLGPSDGGRQ